MKKEELSKLKIEVLQQIIACNDVEKLKSIRLLLENAQANKA